MRDVEDRQRLRPLKKPGSYTHMLPNARDEHAREEADHLFVPMLVLNAANDS